MRCGIVFYFAETIFVGVYGLSDLCVFKDYEGKAALCGRHDVEHTFDFIPPISQNITYIDLRGQPVKHLPYNGFRNLSSQSSISRIKLADCQISDVDAGALLYLHNLTNIDLSHNDIKQLDSKLFSHTTQIRLIYLEYNKIEVLPEGIFQNMLLLEKVYLHHNQIRQVELSSFTNTPSLRIIHLNNNRIESMNTSFKGNFDNLTTLSLYGNPWRCDCEIEPIYELLIKINQLNQHEPKCEKPPTLHGKNWSDISRDEFVCHSEDGISTQQPPSNQNWILILVLVCGVGVIFVAASRKFHIPLRIRELYQGPKAPLRAGENSAASENVHSRLNIEEESIPIHRCEKN